MKQANDFTRPHLLAVARDQVERSRTGAIRPSVGAEALSANVYVDQTIHDADLDATFRQVPLVLAASCELPGPGTYKTMEVGGVPLLLTRDKNGTARTFLNACTHRGAMLVDDCGKASRFTCPYHGWTFAADGRLLAAPLEQEFAMEDKAASGLVALPTEERAGFIWGTLSPDAPLSLDDFLQGLDQLLDILGLASWNVVDQRELPGTNWKLAFDAHLEFYHLPVLHKETFGPDRSNKTLYYFWGPHQRLLQPMRNRKNAPEEMDLFAQRDWPEEQWTSGAMMLGEWIIFPNVSLNLFFDGGLGLLISQVIPGASVGESVTVQTFLSEKPRSEADQQAALDLCDFLVGVVAGEDLPTSAGQEQVMRSGLLPQLQIGGNEEGLQHQHRWLAALRGATGDELPALFNYEPGFNGL